jgi:hypothetical protein
VYLALFRPFCWSFGMTLMRDVHLRVEMHLMRPESSSYRYEGEKVPRTGTTRNYFSPVPVRGERKCNLSPGTSREKVPRTGTRERKFLVPARRETKFSLPCRYEERENLISRPVPVRAERKFLVLSLSPGTREKVPRTGTTRN